MEQKTYEMGNVVLKVKDSSIKAHKCPYLICDKTFFNKSDLYKHLMIEHGEIIDRTKPKLNFSKTFNTEDITQIQIMINKQRLKKYAMIIGELFDPKTDLKKPAKKQRAVKSRKVSEKPDGLFIRIIKFLKKNGERNARGDPKA